LIDDRASASNPSQLVAQDSPLDLPMVIIFFAANPFSLLDFPLDDAWIHRVYSQSFAQGHGFEYNSGQPEAGSTSP
jgi:hypothetical protein